MAQKPKKMYMEHQAFCFDFVFDEMASNTVVYRLLSTAKLLTGTDNVQMRGKQCVSCIARLEVERHTMDEDLTEKPRIHPKGSKR